MEMEMSAQKGCKVKSKKLKPKKKEEEENNACSICIEDMDQ